VAAIAMNGIKLDSDVTVVVNLVFPATQRSMTSTREKACSVLACIRSLNPLSFPGVLASW
jgi:hypothetical protein